MNDTPTTALKELRRIFSDATVTEGIRDFNNQGDTDVYILSSDITRDLYSDTSFKEVIALLQSSLGLSRVGVDSTDSEPPSISAIYIPKDVLETEAMIEKLEGLERSDLTHSIKDSEPALRINDDEPTASTSDSTIISNSSSAIIPVETTQEPAAPELTELVGTPMVMSENAGFIRTAMPIEGASDNVKRLRHMTQLTKDQLKAETLPGDDQHEYIEFDEQALRELVERTQKPELLSGVIQRALGIGDDIELK